MDLEQRAILNVVAILFGVASITCAIMSIIVYPYWECQAGWVNYCDGNLIYMVFGK